QEAARAFLELADRYDADVAMIGDQAQLSAVGRGGVMDMTARVATHYLTLDEVHRFGHDTNYAELSKLMRNQERLDQVDYRMLASVPRHYVTLDEVHRFGNDTDYADLSKLMRNRDRLDEVFDRLVDRGNVRIHHSADEAREALAEAVRSDIAAGRSMAVTVGT